MANDRAKAARGFAAMDDDKQREIARKGGESVPDEKRSFSRNPDLAAAAGRKGGQNVPDDKRSFSQNRELAAAAGRKGGQSVPDAKRSFSQNRELAAAAGRKGGQASHGTREDGVKHEEDTRRSADADKKPKPGYAASRKRSGESVKGGHASH